MWSAALNSQFKISCLFFGDEVNKLWSAWLFLHKLFLMIEISVLKITVIVDNSELAKHDTPPLKGLKSDEKGKIVILASLDFFSVSPEPEEWAEKQSWSPEKHVVSVYHNKWQTTHGLFLSPLKFEGFDFGSNESDFVGGFSFLFPPPPSCSKVVGKFYCCSKAIRAHRFWGRILDLGP